MTTSEASARGRSNRVKGATTERDLAKWLRPWYPDARRSVFNGWTSKDQVAADPGDIDCTSPGLFWSVKNTQVERVNDWMGEINRKCGLRIGILVQKRAGHSSPGEWWTWLRAADLRSLMVGSDLGEFVLPELPDPTAPIRLTLAPVMGLLVISNYAPKAVA